MNWQHSRRFVAMVLYFAGFLTFWLAWGLPTDFFLLFIWLWLAAICWNIDEPWRFHLQWLRDWGPLLVLLVGYDVSRAAAKLLQAPHVTELISADRFLFGGILPTLWLQDHLYDPDQVHWWDVLVSFVYMSHFVASLTVAIVLYLRDRDTWAAFMRRWFFLTAAGLLTYFLYPAAPPWWAAKFGYLTEDVERMSGRGWEAIGLSGTGKLLNAGQAISNPIAAMPSLHSAFAMFIVVFFLPRVRKRWWPLLFCYPLAMTFTLVYTGDHYVIDVLVGWVYVGLTFVVVGRLEKWWQQRKKIAAIADSPADSPHSRIPLAVPMPEPIPESVPQPVPALQQRIARG